MQLEQFVYSVDLLFPLKKREGLVFKLHHEKGVIFAEAAPLPFWSKETLDEVIQESKELLGKNVSLLDLQNALQKSKFPSLQFALEFLIGEVEKTNPSQKQSLLVQGIRLRDEEIIEKRIGDFSTWKIKIRSLQEWLKIEPSFASCSSIRLDSNQGLSPPDLKVLSSLKKEVEFIEEPGNVFLESQIEKKIQVPFALDESLRSSTSSFRFHPLCAAYIFKPTLFGKRSNYEPLIKEALQQGKKIIMSSSFESPIGLFQIATLQEKFPCTTPWGLGTYRYFPEDFCSSFPILIQKGVVEFSSSLAINQKYLTKIA